MKKLPDYILRRVPRSEWNKLRDVPTWEGVLYYDPEDFKLDRPLTFYRRMYCWQLHEEIIASASPCIEGTLCSNGNRIC